MGISQSFKREKYVYLKLLHGGLIFEQPTSLLAHGRVWSLPALDSGCIYMYLSNYVTDAHLSWVKIIIVNIRTSLCTTVSGNRMVREHQTPDRGVLITPLACWWLWCLFGLFASIKVRKTLLFCYNRTLTTNRHSHKVECI